MSTLMRTANCKRCGSTELLIESRVGEINYVCSKCSNQVSTVAYNKYETVRSSCKDCNSKVFKVRIVNNNNEENWEPHCNNCQTTPEKYYIDENGSEIDRQTRELIIIKDSLEMLRDKINILEENLDKLDTKVTELDTELDEHDCNISELKDTVSSCETEISSIEKSVLTIEDSLTILECRIHD